jgi:hypothetical protein
LQNVALLPWYTGSSADLGSTYSFPGASVLTAAAEPCPASGDLWGGTTLAPPLPNVAAIPNAGSGNGHKLIDGGDYFAWAKTRLTASVVSKERIQ